MTPTTQEKQWLRDYLYQVMEYRETFEEVYDHVLLALEDEPEPQFFEGAVAKIIVNDFGSINGLYDLEQNCSSEVELAARQQYAHNFKRWFSTPLVAITVVMFASLLRLYYLHANIGAFLFLFFLLLLAMPTILFSIRGFNVGYRFGKAKPSLKESILRKITFKANIMLWRIVALIKIADLITQYVFNIHHWPDEKSVPVDFFYLLSTSLMLIMTIHLLTVIQLLKTEFQASMTAAR